MIKITPLLNQYEQRDMDLYIADKYINPYEWILTDYLVPPDNHKVLMFNPCDCHLLTEPRRVDFQEDNIEHLFDEKIKLYLEKKEENHKIHGMFIGNYNQRKTYTSEELKPKENTEFKKHELAGEYYLHEGFCQNWNPCRPKYWIPMPRLPFDCKLKDQRSFYGRKDNL